MFRKEGERERIKSSPILLSLSPVLWRNVWETQEERLNWMCPMFLEFVLQWLKCNAMKKKKTEYNIYGEKLRNWINKETIAFFTLFVNCNSCFLKYDKDLPPPFFPPLSIVKSLTTDPRSHGRKTSWLWPTFHKTSLGTSSNCFSLIVTTLQNQLRFPFIGISEFPMATLIRLIILILLISNCK